MIDTQAVIGNLRGVCDLLEHAARYPHGQPVDPQTKTVAGNACVTICGGDQDRARTLWRLVSSDLGYMPHAAAVALIRASSDNLVPDVTAPEIS